MKLIDRVIFKVTNAIRLEQINIAIEKEKKEYNDNLAKLQVLKYENEKLRNN